MTRFSYLHINNLFDVRPQYVRNGVIALWVYLAHTLPISFTVLLVLQVNAVHTNPATNTIFVKLN